MPRAAFALVDSGNPAEVLAFLRSNVGLGRDPEQRAAMVEQAIEHGLPLARQTLAMHCEVAQRFAGWLGFGSGIQAALEHVFERWDGLGFPGVTGGDAIPLPMRLLHVARDISVFLTAAGPEEARAVVERRAGTAYEPRLAELAARNLDDILAELDETRMWEQALELEPFPQVWIAGERVDAAFAAIAAFTDLKSPWYREHSTGVAELAEAAAWRMGLPADAVTLVRRAALAHDLGRAGVSNAIWEKPGRLGFGELGARAAPPPLHASAPSPSRRRSPRSGSWPAHTTNGSTAPATTAARAAPALDQAARILAAADCYGGDARGAAVQAGTRRAGGGGRADARGRGGAARPGRRRRRAHRRRPPRARSDRASCPPG